MRVTFAPIESHLLKQAAEELRGSDYEVVEVSQKDLMDQVEDLLQNTDVLVVDIPLATDFVQAIVQAERSKPDEFEKKLIVGITTVLSWGKTTGDKISDADESRRLPNPGALPLLELERLLMTCSNSQIICHGILYGSGECDRGLKYLFDRAFNDVSVTVYGPGENNLPLVSTKDVVKFIELVVSSKLTKKYCLVVDEVENSLNEVAGCIAEGFGAKIETASLGDVIFLDADIEHLLLDLRMECTKVDDYVFQFSSGLAKDMKAVAAEYTSNLGYTPRAYFFAGAPCSGKSHLARGIAEKCGLEYISREKVEALAEAAKAEQNSVEEDGGNGNAEEEQSLLPYFRKIMEKPNIENKGYVLDGYPGTIQEALELFPNADFNFKEKTEEETQEEGDVAEKAPVGPKVIYPNVALFVKAEDSVLQERAGLAGVEDFSGRSSAFKKTLEEDKKVFQEQLKKLDEATKEQEGAEKTEDEVSKREKVDELIQVSSLCAYFTFMGSKFIDMDNNRKEVTEMPEKTPEEGSEEQADGQAEQDPLFSPLEFLIGKLEGKPEAPVVEETTPEQEKTETAAADETETKPESPVKAPSEVRIVDTEIKQVEELDVLVKPVKAYLASQLGPTISKGFIELIEAKPENPVQFLGEFLIKHSQSKE